MSVYIDGVGVISRCAQSAAELNGLANGSPAQKQALPLAFHIDIPPVKLRRNSRYNKLACAAADYAVKDGCNISETDKRRVGTVISTGYGAAEYFSNFADMVVRGDPGACSPAVFSGSVPNSCVGQICIINGFKGFSTVLAGGDPLEYASLLLKTNRADLFVTGSVEEYFPPLYESLSSFEALSGAELSEGAAMLMLRRERTGNTYCEVCGFGSVSLGKSPYLHVLGDKSQRIADVLRRFETPDMIFTAANGTYFDAIEKKAIDAVFPNTKTFAPKKLFGETLGCGYSMNVAYAAAAIKSGKYRTALVTGADMIGNYCAVYLKAVD